MNKIKKLLVSDGKCYNMETASIKGYTNFLKNNLPLSIAVTITLFFTYGIKLIWNNIGHDTERFIFPETGFYEFFISIGRFGLVLTQKLFFIEQFSPFIYFFVAFVLIWVFTTSWCYIIAIFNQNTQKDNNLIPFALVFMTMPIWTEQFYFVFQSPAIAFMICLCPYIIYLFYKGFLDNEIKKILCALVLLVYMISVYQAIISIFCCGVFACFVFLREHTDYKSKIYYLLCLKIFLSLIFAILIYKIIHGLIIPFVFNIQNQNYLTDAWSNKKSVYENLKMNLEFLCRISIGHISIIRKFTYPVFKFIFGLQYAVNLHHYTDVSIRTFLFAPVSLFFIIRIMYVFKRKIDKGQKILYALAGLGIVISIVIMQLTLCALQPVRTFFALPFAYAFMFYYLILKSKKIFSFVVYFLAIITAGYQAQISAQLQYSDQLRYNEEVRLSYRLDDLIQQIQPDNQKLPVVLVGDYQVASQKNPNYLGSDVIGKPVFRNVGWGNTTTWCGLHFMQGLGINYPMPNSEQLSLALNEAIYMPVYPNTGFVRRVEDFIIVRLSEHNHY